MPRERIARTLSDLWALAPARVAAYVLLYVALAWVSFVHPMRGFNITPWNPQSALAVALLVWRPRSGWLVWLGAASGEAFVPEDAMPWPALLVSTAMLTAGHALIAAGLSKWARPQGATVTRRELALFVLIVAVGVLVGSSLRAGALWAVGEVPGDRVAAVIHRGTIGDGVSLLVTLPLLLLLGSRERRARMLAMFGSLEWWLIAAATVSSVLAVFSLPSQDQFKFFYLIFLPAVWATARFGVTGAVWSSVVVQVMVIVAVEPSPLRPLPVFELQLLVAVLAITGLLLGATVDEREETSRTLRASLRLAAAGDMAAALAHELNQPLTAMSTYAQASQLLAQRLGAADDKTLRPLVDVAGKLVDEAARAAEVVRRLRNFFRDQTTQLQPVVAATLLEDAWLAQVQRARALRVHLTCATPRGAGAVLVDPVQIGLVLRNLVANALDAACETPRTPEVEPWVALEGRRDGGDLLVTVTDSGAGLRGEEAAQVFERRQSQKPGGMGVGLAISRSIIEAHGGRLWAEPGAGGRLVFTLPLEGLAA